MNRKIISSVFAGLLIASVMGMGFVGTVSAQSSECGTFESFFGCENGEADIGVSEAGNAVLGFSDRVLHDTQTLVFGSGSESSPAEISDSVQTDFNSNSSSWVSWANTVVEQSEYTSEYLVVEVTVADEEQENSVHYLEIEFDSNSDVKSASVVDSTSKTVNYDVTISGYLADELDQEYDEFKTEYVETESEPEPSYIAKHGGKYGCDIETDIGLSAFDSKYTSYLC